MDYQKLKDFRNTHNPFTDKLGIWIEEIGPGYAKAVKTVEQSDLNPAGVAHGGVYFSMADTASGAASASHGYYAVTVSADYHYFRSGKPGDVITAEARETKGGKSLCVYDVQVTDQDGKSAGTGTFTYYLLDRKIEL